ncbi:MAG: hypothetical protein IPH62_15125 [Ignavibacteriae bacterium]|nr:hypothetical protein [Ignavibacteriota bacterium]
MAKKKSKNSSLITGIKKGKYSIGATRDQIAARKIDKNSIGAKSSREK